MEKKMFTSPIGKKSTGLMPSAAAPTGKKSTGMMPKAKSPGVTVEPYPAEKHEKAKWCKDHMHRYVLLQTHDGYCADGFVEHIDDEMVCIAVPHCGPHWDRAFLPYPPIYPYPYFPRRRFVRQAFPLTALRGLSLLPFY
ncbi:hypothetical protein ACFPYJ_22060 [Paenibacillus solisilvae]|uniref:Uncharacterized protein n=1 Tax=Paenibacillus solisilvae TaxID=2486751 RepID=A0ABW0W5Q8_9BACL